MAREVIQDGNELYTFANSLEEGENKKVHLVQTKEIFQIKKIYKGHTRY